MSSDEEDFNDIYGDDNDQITSTTNNTETATDVTTSAADSKEENKNAEESSKTGETKEEEKRSDDKESSSGNNVSSLDQLAALQALSSNLNQNNSTESNKNNDSNSNENNNNNNQTPGTMPWEQLQQTMSQLQQGNNSDASPSNTATQEKNVKADISKDNCKMFVGGLNWETTEEGLKEYFSKYGHVVDLKIMKDPNTGRSRGFGFLTFDEPASVDEVVKTQHILDGKVIDPKRSIPREEQDKTGKIFVGGIGPDVRPKEFEEFFAKYGNIIDAQLMLDKDTGRSRGFGFVTYDTPEAVDRVCQSKYIEFKGKQIEIKRAEPRHLQKGQYGGANPNNRNLGGTGSYQRGTGSNSIPQGNDMNQQAMFQNPMMAGFNPMMAGFNPQAMQEYYQKMQEYYNQMQQQTGMDYNQMYQQQMQQMAMMMPGYQMPGQSPQGEQSPSRQQDGSPEGEGSNPSDVQTIGNEPSDMNNDNNNSSSTTPDVSLPRGPRDPSSIPPSRGHNSGGYSHRDRGDRSHRSSYRGGNGSGNGNYRGGSSGGNYRGRSGYGRRNNNGYHPYNRS